MMDRADSYDSSDEQLLAKVLGGPRARSADVSRRLLSVSGGIDGLAGASLEELCRVAGVGRASAERLQASIELGRRAMRGVAPGERLGSSSDVYSTFWPMMVAERTEIFSCALLDSKLRLISTEVISKGTLTASIVHPREAFRPAIRRSASGIIFAHNHPSGDPLPSDEDRRITNRLEEAGRIVGIPLLDHVIIGSSGDYYSFADSGALEPQQSGYRGMVLR
jgi:DNA repair protein RadC